MSDRLDLLRSLSTEEGQGDHTENCGETGHEYWFETTPTSLDTSRTHIHASFSQQVDILDQHNTIVDHNTSQDHPTDRRYKTEGFSGQYVDSDYTDQHERHGKENNKGILERFEQAGHHTKNQYDCEDQDNADVPEHFVHIRNIPTKLDEYEITGYQLFVNQFLDLRFGSRRGIPGSQTSYNVHRTHLILTIDRHGAS